MSLRLLSELLWPLWCAARTMPRELRARPAREQAMAVALEVLGPRVVTNSPAWLNLAALATATRERLVVDQLTPEAAELVSASDLHAVPLQAPGLLARPWVAEVPPDRALWGDTYALGGYALDGTVYLAGLTRGGACLVAPWRPRWGTEEQEIASQDALVSPEMFATWSTWGQQAARWALLYGVLWDARGTPLEAGAPETRPGPRKGEQRDARRAREAYQRRSVSLTARAIATLRGDPATALDHEGLAVSSVAVCGHLRRVPCGPGGREREWQWIEGYSARRWCAPAALRSVRS